MRDVLLRPVVLLVVTVDPLFDAREGYRLRARSSCRNAGNPQQKDKDGSRVDLGAYGGMEPLVID